MGTEGLQELGAFSARFWCEPKTPLKNKACLKGKKPTMRHHLTPIGMATIKTKQNIELSYEPAIPLLGIYPEKTMIQKDTRTPIFIAALFTIAKTGKQPKCPSTDE